MPVVIENPIINSPFAEPSQHYAFDEENKITGNIVSGRRPSSYFVPIASPKKQSKQLTFDSLLTPEKREESGHINRIRAEVNKWRALGWPDTTSMATLAPVRDLILDSFVVETVSCFIIVDRRLGEEVRSLRYSKRSISLNP
jgi:hypothetical protein